MRLAHLNIPAALLLLAALGVRAEPLVSIQSSTIAPIPDCIAHVVSVDARPLAFGAQGFWLLEADRTRWTKGEWHPEGEVLGAAGDGRLAFLLLGARREGPVETVVRLTLAKGVPATSAVAPLPTPLTHARAAARGDALHVVGLDASGAPVFLSMNPLSKAPSWTQRSAWPGAAGEVTSLATQTSAVFITLKGAAPRGERMLRWKAAEGWTERDPVPGSIIEGSARAIGQAHILYFVRSVEAPQRVRLVMFHTITGSWATLAEPDAAPTGAVAGWGNGIVWARTAAGCNATEITLAEIEPGKLLLAWLDWIVIVVYLVSMLGMGLYFYLREKRMSTADFFVGGRTIPFWAAGVSLYAANTSSISYIAIPAKAFETNWQYLTNNLIAVMGLMFVAIWIVPLLRRLNLMSVFQYLETRFHRVIRMLASALFMAVQIGSRMSVILFLPSLAIATITGIDVTWSILIMGVFTMAYTALGGMKAVVWTDFVQLIVKMGGIAFAIGFVVYMLDGGAAQLFSIALAEDKMKLFDFSFDLTKATVWGFVFLVLFDVVLTFPKDQVLMQRVLSTQSPKEAAKMSGFVTVVLMFPRYMLIAGLTVLGLAFYMDELRSMGDSVDFEQILPFVLKNYMPYVPMC